MENKYRKTQTNISLINYHFVFCPRYKRKIFNIEGLEDRVFKEIAILHFLIMNVNDDLKSINRELCVKTYDNFKILHDKEIDRLKELKLNGYKLISSMGI